jgi:hypothetical protein
LGAPGASVFHAAPFAVTVVLDSHGLDTLAAKRARLEELRRRGEWPAIVPCVVLAEALTGDHRRDYHEDRLLRACELRLVDELLARAAAALRSRVSARRPPSAVDAIVVAMADDAGGATILSSDPGDLRALAAHTTHEVTITLAASTTGPVRGRTGASLRGGRPVGTAVTCRVEPRRSGRSRGPTQATPSACTTVPTAASAHSSLCPQQPVRCGGPSAALPSSMPWAVALLEGQGAVSRLEQRSNLQLATGCCSPTASRRRRPRP